MSRANKRIHAFSDDALGSLDAVEVAQLLKKGEVGVKEVIESTIDRVTKINPELKAVAFENYTEARTRTDKDSDGFFAGVPIYFKDMTTIKGIPMTFGSEAFKGAKPANFNDKITKQILSMGFANMGTSTMPEFGFTCSTEFPDLNNTINPWNPTYSAGGSSGGAAALVAAGVVPMAHAADGGGSIRIPASCCGLVGLKPSRGRILNSKSLETQLINIATDGVVTRSVRDTAHFYHEAEKYHRNKKLPEIGLVTEANAKKLKIGFVEGTPTAEPIDEATQKAFDQTIAMLTSLGHELIPVTFPVFEQDIEDFKLLWASNGFGVKHFGKLMFPAPYNPKNVTNLTNGLSSYFTQRILQTPFMLKRVRKTHKTYQQFLEKHDIDIMLSPTVSHLTPPIGHLDMNLDFETIFPRMANWACFTPYSNANGCPSISLPIGHDEEKDLPIGMLFNANHGCEKLLLELSYQLEQAQPWKRIYE